MTWYTEIACTRVAEFIGAIDDTRSGLWHKDALVCRGHADSSWCLRPTLYRNRYGRMRFEIDVVTDFVHPAQRIGLLIPPDAMSYASQNDKENNRNPTNIPSLRNQKGLYLYDPTLPIDTIDCWTKAPSFDVALSEIGDTEMAEKITLDYSDTNLKEIREYLRRRGIVKSYILPTYKNVRDFVMSVYE